MNITRGFESLVFLGAFALVCLLLVASFFLIVYATISMFL